MIYTNKDVILMCTGCPGVPAKLKGKTGRTVQISGKAELTEADKELTGAGFGTCLAIPTVPKKCSSKLGNWTNLKSDVKIKGKKALLFPNTIPCFSGPGLITMTYAGQRKSTTGATNGKEKTYPCDWEGCSSEHEEPSKERFSNQEIGVTTKKKDGTNPKNEGADFTEPWMEPFFFQDDIYGLNKKSNQKNWYTSKDGTKEYTTEMTYTTQRHHVIPVVAVLSKMPKLKKNLKLLGWDVNNGVYNGIRLPMYWQDIFWHDLPHHRGGHSDYNLKVKGDVQEIEDACGELCEKNDLKEAIVNWEDDYLLYSGSLGKRGDSFKRAKITKPKKELYNRKL